MVWTSGTTIDLLKTKPKKKRLYKNYALKGLMRCGECGSLMTPTFTNKKTRRFYYYVCYIIMFAIRWRAMEMTPVPFNASMLKRLRARFGIIWREFRMIINISKISHFDLLQSSILISVTIPVGAPKKVSNFWRYAQNVLKRR